MTYNEKPFSDSALAKRMLEKLYDSAQSAGRNFSFMEVCGTHTMAIAKSGIRAVLPENVRLLSGPGCPVCVTPPGVIDALLQAAALPGAVIAGFGDMLRVRGANGALEDCRLKGADVRVVYSPLDAVAIAEQNPRKTVIFAGVGFETTAPLSACAVKKAKALKLKNFYVYPAFKLVPPALRALLAPGGAAVDGFILPGHVSAVIGLEPYRFIPAEFRLPCVVAGFEPLDILHAVNRLVSMVSENKPALENEYSRAVKPEGNPQAVRLLREVFEPADARWRAIGVIPASGLVFRQEWEEFDAALSLSLSEPLSPEPQGCRCGEVITGKITPKQCPLFKTACTPSAPAGPCMVSSEGACAAWFHYGE
ncbi:MAG: hydrogenase formation protein HypD [Elusimicrobiaceae bacterium]